MYKKTMHTSRFMELIGLLGVLFLIPFIQFQINEIASYEDRYHREEIKAVTRQVYNDVQKLICEQLGEQAGNHDCTKGVYQDGVVQVAIEAQETFAEFRAEFVRDYWITVGVFGFVILTAAYIGFRREYRLKEQES
ncbi:hypothetical protein JL49_17045 [Pseudoalteromonas luteoviolacea]|nr:hypothetical protein JL49_17045 [Pseudoalteromonas luteoviolacea]